MHTAEKAQCEVGKAVAAVCEGAFFNREAELRSLNATLADYPTAVLVLTGPPSCGKSALLKQLVAGTKQSPRPTVIDCRAGDYMSPEAFAANLVECTKSDWQLDETWLSSVLPSLANVAGASVKVELQKDPRTALQTIIAAYLKLVKDAKRNRKNGDPWPVIIVDEANALIEWEDKKSLNALLKFFVYLTKQEKLAHVILATSDTCLTQWLESGPIKGPFRSPFVVGNLSREEAHTFFFDYVLPFRKHPPGADAAWERVYEVCGGNPGSLQTCAGKAAALSNWEHGCNAIVQTAMTDITNGLRPAALKDAEWNAEDFSIVIRSIVDSPYAAVPVQQLDATLGDGGTVKLKSMNKLNLLLLRAYDPLARDMDAAAFEPDLEDVYTLPSVAHVLAARRKLKL